MSGLGGSLIFFGRRVYFFYILVFGFYFSMLFEVIKLKIGKSVLEVESESLDSYTVDLDSTFR